MYKNSRVQLALNVSDLDAAIQFYSRLFGTGPAKVREGYANFLITDPPLKLVLIEHEVSGSDGVTGKLNHLGIEVSGPSKVKEAQDNLEASGLPAELEEGIDCCYAIQDKVWVYDPDGAPWEVYTVLADTGVDAKPSTCCANDRGL